MNRYKKEGKIGNVPDFYKLSIIHIKQYLPKIHLKLNRISIVTKGQLTPESGPFVNNRPGDLIYNLKTPKQQSQDQHHPCFAEVK